jgi:hypothetical protein
MRFMMLMIPQGDQSAPGGAMPAPEPATSMMKYNRELKEAGVLLALDGLHPPGAGVRVSFSGSKPAVIDGPFAGAREAPCGYWMIQVKSREEAVEWAKRCPAGAGNVIDVRQVREMSDLPTDVQRFARF